MHFIDIILIGISNSQSMARNKSLFYYFLPALLGISTHLVQAQTGVGIGTTNPQATLHIAGDFKFIPDNTTVATRLVGLSKAGDLVEIRLGSEFQIVHGELQVTERLDDNILLVGGVDLSGSASTKTVWNDFDLGLSGDNTDNTVIRLTGETSGYSISGFQGGFDGRVIYVYNSEGNNLTFIDASTSASLPENRILTGTGGNVGTNGQGVAEFIYDGSLKKWLLINIRS